MHLKDHLYLSNVCLMEKLQLLSIDIEIKLVIVIKQKKFIFNAKNLNPSLSLAEAGIAHNSNIFVVTTKGVHGAF